VVCDIKGEESMDSWTPNTRICRRQTAGQLTDAVAIDKELLDRVQVLASLCV